MRQAACYVNCVFISNKDGFRIQDWVKHFPGNLFIHDKCLTFFLLIFLIVRVMSNVYNARGIMDNLCFIILRLTFLGIPFGIFVGPLRDHLHVVMPPFWAPSSLENFYSSISFPLWGGHLHFTQPNEDFGNTEWYK